MNLTSRKATYAIWVDFISLSSKHGELVWKEQPNHIWVLKFVWQLCYRCDC